jgi:hypothetical protein
MPVGFQKSARACDLRRLTACRIPEVAQYASRYNGRRPTSSATTSPATPRLSRLGLTYQRIRRRRFSTG